jgi:hypothetical protein
MTPGVAKTLGYVLHRVFTEQLVECTNLSVRVTYFLEMAAATLAVAAFALKAEAARL